MSSLMFVFGWIRENMILALTFVIIFLFLVVGCQRMRVNYLKRKIDRVRVVRPDTDRRKIFPIFRDEHGNEHCGCLDGEECTCEDCKCGKDSCCDVK